MSERLKPSPVGTRSDDDGEAITRVMRPARAAPDEVLRPTRAEINLANIRDNLAFLTKRSRVPLWAVLKADAYGHGAKAVARSLERAKVPGLCVALVEEAIELREAGIALPILVMGAHYDKAWPEVLHHELTPALHRVEQIAECASVARSNQRVLRVHLKIDTGMGRLGILPADVERAASALRAAPELHFEGLMTHFARAEFSADVEEQLRTFERVTTELGKLGCVPELRHAAGSAALLGHPGAALDLARPGIALMGESPSAQPIVGLKPAMRVKTVILALRDLEVGQSTGYGRSFIAQRPSRIATIPMGYADGLSRMASNNGEVLVRGRRTPIVGTVSMDLTTLDVTDVPGADINDEVVILGEQRGPLGQEFLSAREVASRQGTIAWEILTNISRRVPRFYFDA